MLEYALRELYPRAYLERARTDHQNIVQAIISRDTKNACQAGYRHFSMTYEIMSKNFIKFTT